MQLSVILPVFNGSTFICESLQRLDQYLKSNFESYEIIAVNDGSRDATAQELSKCSAAHIKVLTLSENQGKFGAIRAGVKAAEGKCIVFTDADLPYDFEALVYIERLINHSGFHVVIGDRALPGSQYRELLPFIRKCCTLIFSHSVRLLVTGELFDTQCGLKGFRADIAKELFPLLTDRRFAADVELLYITLKYNLATRRIPVRLQRQGPSTVRSLQDGLQMFLTIAKLKKNWLSGKYKSAVLFDVGKQFYWKS